MKWFPCAGSHGRGSAGLMRVPEQYTHPCGAALAPEVARAFVYPGVLGLRSLCLET